MVKRLSCIILSFLFLFFVLPMSANAQEQTVSISELPSAEPSSTPEIIDSGTCGDTVYWKLDSEGLLTIYGEGDMVEIMDLNHPIRQRRDQIITAVIEDGVTSLSEYLFMQSASLTTLIMADSVATIRSQACYAATNLSTVKFSENLTSISFMAFRHTALTEVYIPDTVTRLGQYVFMNCNSLTFVHLPDSLQSMGSQCFDRCPNLTTVEFPDGWVEIPWDAFCNTGLTNVELPNSIIKVGLRAFRNCQDLVSVHLPDGVTFLGDDCFDNCTSLTTINIPASLTEIRSGVFRNCTALEMLVIPDTVTLIRPDAFEGCTNLTLGCYYMSDGHLFAVENEIPYVILDEKPETAIYPITIHATFGGSVAVSSLDSPAGRYVLLQYVPDDDFVLDSITYYLADGSGAELEYSILDETSMIFVMPPCEVVFDINFLSLLDPFTDVNPDSFYYHAVLWAASRNITNGTGLGVFSPDQICTRAEVVTFLWRAAGWQDPRFTEHAFTDIVPDSYYYKAALWAVENSITNGVDATHFAPDRACTRAEVVTFLWRACGQPTVNQASHPFVDIEPGSYYEQAALWAYTNGITQGTDASHFSPDQICTRSQIVTFLYRTFY